MQYSFNLPGTPAPRARLVTGNWLGGFQLFVNGKEIKRSTEAGKPFLVPVAGGATLRLEVKGGGLDFVPKVTVDGAPIQVAEPLPRWQAIVALIPFALILVGGAIGGGLGGAAAMVNLSIMRGKASTVTKVLLSVVVTLAAFAGYVVLVGLLQGLINR